MKTRGKRVCPACGTLFSENGESCPVCALRGALGKKQSISESPTEPTLSPSQLRLEHYEILAREDGTPMELGRGAMGVTYKALDVNLRNAVALKVINARFIGDKSAHRRFLREARAAASVRHPNVASVFHLGKSGDNYFYAMEFVEGETLDNLIKRSGRLKVKLALEIVTQATAGLAAIHQQNLVHRDIKPSNIMVALKDGSDLYSLGIVLWEMLTGKVPFSGSAAEVMYQHLHTPSPVERLKGIPQPAVILVETLLKKIRTAFPDSKRTREGNADGHACNRGEARH